MGLYSNGPSVAATAVLGLMSDRCRIWSPLMADEGTVDPVTFEVTFPAPEVLWEGPCLFQPAASSVEQAAGGGTVRTTEDRVKLPADAAGFRVGDRLELIGVAGEFEIVRVPLRSVALSVTVSVRRREDVPGGRS